MLWLKEPFTPDPMWKAWELEQPNAEGSYLYLSHHGVIDIANWDSRRRTFWTRRPVCDDGVCAPAALNPPFAWAERPPLPAFARSVTGLCADCRHRRDLTAEEKDMRPTPGDDSACANEPGEWVTPTRYRPYYVMSRQVCPTGKFEAK